MHGNSVPIVERVKGQWYQVLRSLGVDERFLANKHGPCPLCGGRDRYRWDDKNGRGTYYCQCGPGDGFQLLMKLNGWTFPETAKHIEEVLGDTPTAQSKQKYKPDPLISIKKIMNESREIKPGDAVSKYLEGRGLYEIPKDLLVHPALYEPDSRKEFPALLGLVRGPKGDLVTVHRTFIQNGKKAPIASPRKIMPPIGTINGAAIRLYPLEAHIGIAEGIETSMAARRLLELPVWSVMNANGMKTFIPPDGVEEISFCGDNDKNFAGQAAAYHGANKLATKGYRVNVFIPEKVGGDWLDLMNPDVGAMINNRQLDETPRILIANLQWEACKSGGQKYGNQQKVYKVDGSDYYEAYVKTWEDRDFRLFAAGSFERCYPEKYKFKIGWVREIEAYLDRPEEVFKEGGIFDHENIQF